MVSALTLLLFLDSIVNYDHSLTIILFLDSIVNYDHSLTILLFLDSIVNYDHSLTILGLGQAQQWNGVIPVNRTQTLDNSICA
jgi:hypothetical protein